MKPPTHFTVIEHGRPDFSNPALVHALAEAVLASMRRHQEAQVSPSAGGKNLAASPSAPTQEANPCTPS